MKAFGLTQRRGATKAENSQEPPVVHTQVQDADFAPSGSIGDDQESWMDIDVSGPGTVQFQWKVSSQSWCDYPSAGSGQALEFCVDGVCRSSISGERDWQQETFTLTAAGSHRLQWRYYKDSSEYEGDDCGYVKAVTFTPPPRPWRDYLAQAVDSLLVYTTGGSANWRVDTTGRFDSDSAQSGALGNSQQSWMQTTVEGPGTLTFWWKVSSEQDYDWLEFYLDNQLQSNPLSGEVDWEQKSFTITGSGTHTLKWRYVKDSSASVGDDCGWVDAVQWTGSMPEPAPGNWATLNYVYDAAGRRIEKRCDGRTITKYVYDGDHCIAEYDASGNLRRKYIYGPGVDEPICMIESTQSYAGTYYYHFDALGSVVALTNSSGNTVEVYEYDVYGRVGASDASHPNRFMFTGREFDKETGLYYYRARYYNPQIGRFLQTDPVGYEAGMHLYGYCGNNPIGLCDASGCDPNWDEQWNYQFVDGSGEKGNAFSVKCVSANNFLGWLAWYGGSTMPSDFLIENLFGKDANWGAGIDATFEEVYYLGVKVVRVNGINLLDNSKLDDILKADEALQDESGHSSTFDKVNQWDVPSSLLDKLADMFTFHTAFAGENDAYPGPKTWLFYGGDYQVPVYTYNPEYGPIITGYETRHSGGKYQGSEINWIILGHAAAKAGIPLAVAEAAGRGYNQNHRQSRWYEEGP